MTVAKQRGIPKFTEAVLIRQCIAFLERNGCHVWRNNTGAASFTHKGKRRFIRYGAKGSPDIIGYTKDGQFIGVECKVRGRPTPGQAAWLALAQNCGCVAFCCCTLIHCENEWELQQ